MDRLMMFALLLALSCLSVANKSGPFLEIDPIQDSDVCSLPPVRGRCKARFEKYFYNSEEGECQIFYYGGCGGNGNRFKSIEDCKERCLE
ncbi:PI-actitoxin-Aeq3b-like isoform X2 [Glandiceps talaboti]